MLYDFGFKIGAEKRSDLLLSLVKPLKRKLTILLSVRYTHRETLFVSGNIFISFYVLLLNLLLHYLAIWVKSNNVPMPQLKAMLIDSTWKWLPSSPFPVKFLFMWVKCILNSSFMTFQTCFYFRLILNVLIYWIYVSNVPMLFRAYSNFFVLSGSFILKISVLQLLSYISAAFTIYRLIDTFYQYYE